MSVLIPGKLLFLEHPRTASTSATEMLLGMGGVTVAPQHYDAPSVTGVMRVCVVRNVFEVLASWMHAVRWRGTTSEFVNDYRHWNDKYIRDGRLFYFVESCDAVIHYSRLQSGWANVLREVGITPCLVPWVNMTFEKKPVKSYYTDQDAADVYAKFRSDIHHERVAKERWTIAE